VGEEILIFSCTKFLNNISIRPTMKTIIDFKIVEHLAKLSRLELSNEEKIQFTDEIKEIIDVFSVLDKVDTDKVPSSIQPVDIKNVLRQDEPEESFSQEDALKLDHNKKDGYFKGPKAV
jgi:aspartyl-tRNA(Asn)/glutamyl-tRNA(Gln) amidotransferase subunit C